MYNHWHFAGLPIFNYITLIDDYGILREKSTYKQLQCSSISNTNIMSSCIPLSRDWEQNLQYIVIGRRWNISFQPFSIFFYLKYIHVDKYNDICFMLSSIWAVEKMVATIDIFIRQEIINLRVILSKRKGDKLVCWAYGTLLRSKTIDSHVSRLSIITRSLFILDYTWIVRCGKT